MKKINFIVLNKHIAILLLAAALIFHPRFLQAQSTNFDFDKEFEKTAQLIVMLKAGDEGSSEFGAGIVFGREKDRLLIATAHHILRTAGQPANIKVQFRSMPPDKYLVAKLLRYDKEGGKDIAVLSVENPQKQGIDICALPFNRLGKVDNVKRGNSVFSVGNPNGISWAIPVAADRISQIRGDEIVFQSSFISSGHSGGGLLDAKANLIGMITADQPPFGRAINFGAILRLVKQWGYPVQLDTLLPSKRTPLHLAASKGNLAAIKYHLTDCGNPNALDDHNANPLHFAAFNGNVEALSFLLKAGANPNTLDGDGDLPLVWAIQKGCFECVKVLVKAGTKINNQNEKGVTALHIAIDSSNYEIARFLVEAGANVNLQNNEHSHTSYHLGYKLTPLHYAVWSNQLETVKMLLKAGANVNLQNNNKDTPLYFAIEKGNLEIVQLLLKAGAKNNLDDRVPPYHIAVSNKNVEMIRLLRANGVNVEISDNRGETALLYCLKRNYSENVIKALIEAGANVNVINKEYPNKNFTPFRYVLMENGSEELLKKFVKSSTDLNVQDTNGNTALHEVVANDFERDKRNLKYLQILLDAGSNPNIKNNYGETPLSRYNTYNRGKADERIIKLLTQFGGK